MRIPDTILERLNSQADLVAMIKKHTTLKPAGREFKGCCPFHGEKTPSFYVNPQTNLYYCFGCGVKGNPISFLRDFERLTFKEAVELLADQTGIDLPKDDHTPQQIQYKKTANKPNNINTTPNPSSVPDVDFGAKNLSHTNHQPTNTHLENLGQNDLSQPHWHHFDPNNTSAPTSEEGNLYALLDQICQFYQHQLANNSTARQYFLSRGLTEQTIHEFGLGYAPTGWQHLEQAFPYDIEGLRILGLVRTSQKGRDFDLLRDRVIFPIKDRQGRIVGFAGRSLGDEMPKYINSSESPVFAKQHILYGLYEARRAKATDFLVVEGYMDVIALHQAGIYGAVAPMGTAINENQIAHLLKYNDTLTLCFDGDEAGQRASWRALEVSAPILTDDKQLKFLTLSGGHDPDTYIKAFGTEATRTAITQAKSTSDYVYDTLKSRHDTATPEGKAQAMSELKSLTGKFPKGSSFKWWLNSDIYARFKDKKSKRTSDTIIYDSQLDRHTQLCLCLLYTPNILNQDPLVQLFQSSSIHHAHIPYEQRLHNYGLDVPPLPTWQMLHDDLAKLVSVIQQLLQTGYIQTNNNPTHIDGQAHLIMASLPNPTLQHKLTSAWREFFHQLQHHHPTANHEEISLFFNELLCQALQDALKKQHEESKNLILSEIHKRRMQLLTKWDNEHTKTQLASLFEKRP
ncbi:DNA primase [Moraxella oblonga]|uniref:DNA primase n=1 Tax=Moraxella oblonga TaxID=200413 RepID=UPI0008339BE3|nr:CHC2 zinc finger domain-containing protein [Moraxella oblonga]